MLSTIYLSLCISQYIFFAIGQTVQSMPPAESCTASTVTLRCPNGYVVVVKSAFYGVAQTEHLCSYKPGDCIADTMSTVACTTDSTACNVFALKKKLPQCNDQTNSYIHIEYDCVPIHVQDQARVYEVCNGSSSITTESGILRSPGYPTQFQATIGECFRAIAVPKEKTIRLWLTDLYIGSTAANCAKDYVYVVDSVQTFAFCGSKRFAYPYLCSSSILIQYLATTQLSIYRGMRMYFDFVDRSPNDGCPDSNATITAIPASTTTPTTTTDPSFVSTTPVYAGLGIVSPVMKFQLCKGQSRTLECPNGYAITVITNLFGVTDSDLCEPYDADKHCVVTTNPTVSCRQRCTYVFNGNQRVPGCENKIATYQYVEYQCIPVASTLVSNNTVCPANGAKIPLQINRVGRFRSNQYPSLQKENCTYRLKTNPGEIMSIYSLDVALNDYSTDCKSNKLIFAEDGDDQVTEFCEQRTYSLLYTSCSNELDLRYVITNDQTLFSYGAELYIESRPRPSDWSCGKPLVTTARSTTNPSTGPLTTSDPAMSAAPEVESDICVGTSFNYQCPLGYTYMIIGAFYGVKKSPANSCRFTPGDCVQEAASTITVCTNDLPTCFLSYSTRRRLALCSDNYADYLHITGQCVPSRPVGAGAILSTTDICNSTDDIRGFQGVITSPGFPNYKQSSDECKRTIAAVTDSVLKIWIIEMVIASGGQRSNPEQIDQPDLVIRKTRQVDDLNELEQLNPSIRDTCVNDYLVIDSPQIAYVFCGKRKLALTPICASTITIKYKSASTALFNFKGFKLYFEWMPKSPAVICSIPIDPSVTTTIVNQPLPIWAQNLDLSPILSQHLCLRTTAILRCPREDDYVISIIDANYAVTGTGQCEVPAPSHCRQTASLDIKCTRSCTIVYNVSMPLVQCANRTADYLSIDYECIPTRLPNNQNPTDICSSTTTETVAIDKGMLISPQYPNLGPAHICSKTIEAPPLKLWMVFVVDVFLEGENDFGDCDASSLTIFDGNDKFIRCGLHQPELIMISCSNFVQFNFVSTHEAVGYRGFKVYFQTVDRPSDWSCVPTLFNSTTAASQFTTRPITISQFTNRPTTASQFTTRLTTASQFTTRPTTASQFTARPTTASQFTTRPTTASQFTARPTAASQFTTRLATSYFTTRSRTIISQFTARPTAASQFTTRPTTPASQFTTRSTTTTTTSLVPPSLQIGAFGGTTNGIRQFCQFPFTYQGKPQSSCLRTDPPSGTPIPGVVQPWCSLTADYDRDLQWGFCNLGVTGSTSYDICRNELQSLNCPQGYLIAILKANYAAKPNGNIGSGACNYDPNDCLQSAVPTLQSTCAGKASCTAFHSAQTLASCQNRPTAYMHVEYTCIPNTIQDIPTYSLCNSTVVPQGDTRRGYLTSPEFPRSPSGIDCTFNLQTVQPFQEIYLYILEMDLNTADSFGQPCKKDRLIINSDNRNRELCGRATTDLLMNTCHASITLQLIRSWDAQGRGVKLYFEVHERSSGETCEQVTTSGTRQTSPASTMRESKAITSYRLDYVLMFLCTMIARAIFEYQTTITNI